jgi:hypothetical protein
LASCNDENSDNKNINADKGKPTDLTLSLNFPQSGASLLRSTSDPNATDPEATIHTVDVFIYTKNQGFYLSHTSLTASDFTKSETADSYTLNSSTKIQTTTGDRLVFVGVNLPSTVALALEHQGSSEVTQVAKSLTRDQLVSANGIAMIGVLSCTFVEDADNAANHPEITVKRMVAKVTVQKGNSMTQEGVSGKLDSLSFAINNFNERSFLIQGAAPEYKDPNWDSYDPAAFSQVNYSNSYYLLVNDSLITDPKALKPLYASENTSKTHKKREITRVTIRGAFLPDTMMVYQNPDYIKVSTASQGITKPKTFYTVTLYRPNPEIKIFYNSATAEAYAIANGLTSNDVITYTGGYCYWDLFLNKNVWDVLRNDYYKATITRIIVPGRSTEEIPDDELDDEPSVEVNITTNLEILDWIVVSDNYELEP